MTSSFCRLTFGSCWSRREQASSVSGAKAPIVSLVITAMKIRPTTVSRMAKLFADLVTQFTTTVATTATNFIVN